MKLEADRNVDFIKELALVCGRKNRFPALGLAQE